MDGPIPTMTELNGQFLLQSWIRLLVACLVLMWLWSGARRRVERSGLELPVDLAWTATMTWTVLALTLVALGLGALGLLTDWSWALGAVAAGAIMRRGTTPADRAAPSTDGDPPSRLFQIGLGGYLLGRALFSLRNPPADWDSLDYHLPMIADWIQTHTLGVALRVPEKLGSYFPGNAEVLQMGAAWLLVRDTLMSWPGILALALLGLMSRRLALAAGAPRAVAEGLALCLAAAPGVSRLVTGIRADNVMAAWIAVALVFALRFRRQNARADLETAVIALGLMAGCKTTGPAIAVLLLGVVLAGPGFSGRMRELARCRGALLMGATAALFWPVRNVLASGNPVYPAQLQLGPWLLPGVESHAMLVRTTQLATWREGYAGHLTLPYLSGYFGPYLWIAALAPLVGFALKRIRPAPSRPMDPVVVVFSVLAIASLAMFIVTPFSGAYWPAVDGRPPRLSRDNLRLLMPTAIAMLPLIAAGLKRLPSHAAGLVLGTLFLVGLVRNLTHVVPAMALVAAGILVWHRFRNRVAGRPLLAAAGIVAVAGGVALLGTLVEPMRERISDRIWDEFAFEPSTGRRLNLPASAVRELRSRLGGRPVALVGVQLSWAYFGRDFSSRPVYVPLATRWDEANRPYRFIRDPRERSHRETWERNLAAAGAAYVVTAPFAQPGPPSTGRRVPTTLCPVESDWCAEEPARFREIARLDCVQYWEVKPVPAARGGSRARSRPSAVQEVPDSTTVRSPAAAPSSRLFHSPPSRQRTRHAASGSRV